MLARVIKKIFLAAGISMIIILAVAKSTTINDWQFYFLKEADRQTVKTGEKEKIAEQENPTISKLAITDDAIIAVGENKQATETVLAVPFTPQAPFGEWQDPRQQDGCEEASMLMAISWARGEKLSREQAKQEILAIAEFEKATYGSFIDTDVDDTVQRIAKDYFKYEQARAVRNINIADIKNELVKGNVVLVPADGRKLGNPNYTPPGPARHMLVIRGYDQTKKEFITNDSGTRKGEGYRYDENILFKAIVNYPTGDHEPLKQEEKAMIVVWR
ncbi:MAG: C39 family peptidase [Candidatus Falkowbacteria bacterium]|nr:C39 family peptidase [Candidatus Falkowbacteria bacterium]